MVVERTEIGVDIESGADAAAMTVDAVDDDDDDCCVGGGGGGAFDVDVAPSPVCGWDVSEWRANCTLADVCVSPNATLALSTDENSSSSLADDPLIVSDGGCDDDDDDGCDDGDDGTSC
jgi:hypothetical protein